ncbi:sulfur carrier protein ThiS [Rhodococcus sp. SGAir0479]|uniref:sulfur carrier protein ThiS n=1 Tax=Rhodococcus sp. SGAir0479 TaxID=2567884 RepID=UPI0010CCD6FC|nr:sulfur carrier protein ThiS [Rhodococcus sp. SGAir0479]QCQ92442.1 sulfur carrier protein ThiS [Rhodococcus sp. SGAir0479]
MSELIGVTVNGEDREFDGPLTVTELLERMDLPQRGIAVAVGGAVFPRGRWTEPVGRGWEIEILTAVQGG